MPDPCTCNPLHSNQQVADGIHIPFAFDFATIVEMNSASVVAGDVGKFANTNNHIYMLTSISPPTWLLIGPVSLDGYLTSTDGYITDAYHLKIDQLVHTIVENSYEELTYSGNNVTADTIWTSAGKTMKIREELYTYGNGHVTTIVTKQYDDSGNLVETMTENYTYTSGKVSNITRTLT